METNDHKIRDYSATLDTQYRALGSLERAKVPSCIIWIRDTTCLVLVGFSLP
ncbi:MAG: hypothetical protein H6Q13_2041 [Bacteroidetes bacterium]|nr:hypothetical protein [Bacteroidota bacterium]